MPKTKGTRRHQAADLVTLLIQGPASIAGQRENGQRMTKDEARAAYDGWVQNQVMPKLYALVPELKGTRRG
jgi:hypothetical protein